MLTFLLGGFLIALTLTSTTAVRPITLGIYNYIGSKVTCSPSATSPPGPSLRWRIDHDRELVWTVDSTHPIAKGIPHPIVIPEQEMYGEQFDIPAPDELVFISSFTGGEVFRSGCTFRRGHGKIFYFSPGDQDYPVYHHPDVRHVIANAVEWAVSDRSERAVPVLLRYDREDFFNGHGYAGALHDHDAAGEA